MPNWEKRHRSRRCGRPCRPTPCHQQQKCPRPLETGPGAPKPLTKPGPAPTRAMFPVGDVPWHVAPTVPAPPVPTVVKAVYIDWRDVDWNDPGSTLLAAANGGFNLVLMAFFVSNSGAGDMCKAWEGIAPEERASVVDQLHAKGARLGVSAGGEYDNPFSLDPATYAQGVAKWAQQYLCDHIDFDLEGFGPGLTAGGMTSAQTITWLTTVTTTAKSAFPSASISHAPQAPYFSPDWTVHAGGYAAVYNNAPAAIDFFLVQFYNQTDACYTSYSGLFETSCTTQFAGSAVQQIAAQGVPLKKIVVGKPTSAETAGSGVVSASDLKSWFDTAATSIGWNSGLMLWDFGSSGGTSASAFLATVYPPSSSAERSSSFSRPHRR